MSRSRRRNPFCGATTASSDKPFKEAENRAARRRARIVLRVTQDGDATPGRREYGDPWRAPKDGKQRFGLDRPEMFRK